jgi:hypothetical protein
MAKLVNFCLNKSFIEITALFSFLGHQVAKFCHKKKMLVVVSGG